MVEEKKQMTKEEILSQLPDHLQTRRFASAPVTGYTSEWVGEPESALKILWRKVKENPFIPIGLGGTVYFLSRGLFSMVQGNKQMSQKMMRGRVFAQGFTVASFIIGLSIENYRRNRKEQEPLDE